MNLKSLSCPNCKASYNPTKYRCKYCGSYVFMSNENYKDLRNIEIELPPKSGEDTGKYPGVYVFGRLLGKGERPIAMGAANYFTGDVTAGGKLLLTNKSLSFSAHAFNIGRQETRIDLKDITDVKVVLNLIVSQHIVAATEEEEHKFVVFHGKKWVENIREAIEHVDEPEETEAPEERSGNYIEELKQLKELMDMGVITEEEFNLKKRMVLGL